MRDSLPEQRPFRHPFSRFSHKDMIWVIAENASHFPDESSSGCRRDKNKSTRYLCEQCSPWTPTRVIAYVGLFFTSLVIVIIVVIIVVIGISLHETWPFPDTSVPRSGDGNCVIVLFKKKLYRILKFVWILNIVGEINKKKSQW